MGKETPMIKQYKAIKEKNKDKILLFRVGDFYEMFFEDAKIGAKELEIALTSRETGKGNHVPLAGFPYHALNSYLGRFIERGYKVAICEQVEDPKLAKGLVKREIVQVITPGTVTETALLQEKSNNYLVSVYLKSNGMGLAAVDVSTGEFIVTEARGRKAAKTLIDELYRLKPAEILVNDSGKDSDSFKEAILRLGGRQTVNPRRDTDYSFVLAEKTLLEQFHVRNLESLDCADLKFAVLAAGCALIYLRNTQKKGLSHIHKPSVYNPEGYMVLDATARRNLELVRTIRDGQKYGTMLWVLDKTKTAMGGRLLKKWLEQPLLDLAEINKRLDTVEEILADFSLENELAAHLDEIYDLERLLGRVHCENAHARDLLSLCSTLSVLPRIIEVLSRGGRRLAALAAGMPNLTSLAAYLKAALADDPPLVLHNGGLIRKGFNAEVDRLREISRKGRKGILEIERQERERTGIKSLKIGYNKVFGYYIEVSRVNLHLVPQDYIRKQTLANAERYITQELKDFENTVLNAEEKVCSLEYEIFLEIRQHVARHTADIQKAAALVAEIDVYRSLARVAREYNYVRPRVTDGTAVTITDGRHPVVERVMQDKMFVPNDTVLSPESQQILLITGPNMAGKSTYLRQTALIVLMAQIGSFVPARQAEIGIVDRIFTRIGAADDLVGGQSTFMVEMSEMANILNQATEKSLIILDEVGRGTSTYDGMSIARAIIEYLCKKIKARTLFATHYHELADLADEFPLVKNYTTAIKERGEEIIFLHKVIPGSINHSYGLQVARLAGIPQNVIARAREVLLELEKGNFSRRETAAASEETQMRLFQANPALSAALAEIGTADFLTITPLESMQLLYKLQQALKKGNENGNG